MKMHPFQSEGVLLRAFHKGVNQFQQFSPQNANKEDP